MVNMSFTRAEFWIQVHNAPLICMTKEMGEFLGRLIGDLVDIDVGSTGECFGKFMRMRVAIDISKPLKRFLRVDLADDGEESLLLLRYKGLPEFCFNCGLVGHSFWECPTERGENSMKTDLEYEFGP
ncbi:hypothetical protein EZV62_001402 [Acer yangbiense]|uniref:CCHC-type domain-containing protein n=1 Tax=Acer yangbiense TaxID=1000413 RepID=A0A5C7ITV3_9ROSI|nr:hypothetical protein EZV62_001402 [Acer yangbiense]